MKMQSNPKVFLSVYFLIFFTEIIFKQDVTKYLTYKTKLIKSTHKTWVMSLSGVLRRDWLLTELNPAWLKIAVIVYGDYQ